MPLYMYYGLSYQHQTAACYSYWCCCYLDSRLKHALANGFSNRTWKWQTPYLKAKQGKTWTTVSLDVLLHCTCVIQEIQITGSWLSRLFLELQIYHLSSGGGMAWWLGHWICHQEIPGSNPPPRHWLDLCLVVQDSTPPRFVNSQLVSLPPVGIFTSFCSIDPSPKWRPKFK